MSSVKCGGDLHEDEPQNLTVGISIQNLIKIYDDVRVIHFFMETLKNMSFLLCFRISCSSVVQTPAVMVREREWLQWMG